MLRTGWQHLHDEPRERLDDAVRAAVSDPKGEYVVVNMPHETERQTRKQRVVE
jgi:hypothetical protein